MNFISHYYFDHNKGNPYYNFGLILPDLMSIYRRGWKIQSKKIPTDLSEINNSIYTGALKHLESDSVFHQSAYFIKYSEQIKNILVSNHLKVKKSSSMIFLTHILLELMNDVIIIKNENDILDRFYSDLEQINHQIIKDFYKGTQIELADGFYDFFARFRDNKFFYSYKDRTQFPLMVNRVLMRAKLTGFDEEEEMIILNQSIGQIESVLEENFEEYLKFQDKGQKTKIKSQK